MDTNNEFALLRVLNGKWKVAILYIIGDQQVVRFGQLCKSLPDITPKVLTAHLRALEKDGIVKRRMFATVPVKVEYSLSRKGLSICPVLKSMREWERSNTH